MWGARAAMLNPTQASTTLSRSPAQVEQMASSVVASHPPRPHSALHSTPDAASAENKAGTGRTAVLWALNTYLRLAHLPQRSSSDMYPGRTHHTVSSALSARNRTYTVIEWGAGSVYASDGSDNARIGIVWGTESARGDGEGTSKRASLRAVLQGPLPAPSSK